MASELVTRLIAANEGSQQAVMGSDIFYLAAERIAFLEQQAEDLRASRLIADSLADDYHRLNVEARSALQTIYAINGEDPEIEKICCPLIDKLD